MLPVAAFTSSATNLVASFDGSASTDSDGTITGYAWTFGDNATGSGVKTTHTYASAGTYTVSLKVTDNAGGTNTVSHPITVSAAKCVADVRLDRQRHQAGRRVLPHDACAHHGHADERVVVVDLHPGPADPLRASGRSAVPQRQSVVGHVERVVGRLRGRDQPDTVPGSPDLLRPERARIRPLRFPRRTPRWPAT